MRNDDEKKFVKDFFEFIETESEETFEELKEELEQEGIDVDAAYTRFQGKLSKLIQKRKAEVREKEKAEMHKKWCS